MLVPAYFNPEQTNSWRRLIEAAERVPVLAIANVFNGPGNRAREDYRNVLTQLRTAGGRAVGYVHSTYTRRPVAEVLADVDRWAEFYPLDGIFVDEMANDGAEAGLKYYEAIHQHVRQRRANWIVIGNPGTQTREPYLTRPTADILVTFENNTGYLSYRPDAWTREHSPQSFAHLTYSVNETNLVRYLGLARNRGAGWIYVTDDGGNNPWDRLPLYWELEVDHVRQLNQDVPLQIEAVPHTTNSVRLVADSVPGRYKLETSSNLVDWAEWFSGAAPTGRLEVLVPTNPAAVRFLRARR